MKPPSFGNWSGRVARLLPPAGLLGILAARFFAAPARRPHGATNRVAPLADPRPGSLRHVLQKSAPRNSTIFSVTRIMLHQPPTPFQV